MHHSGALLLEARDGAFLDAQLCSSSGAASNDLQLACTAHQTGNEPMEADQPGNNFAFSGQGEYSNDFDDGGGGDGDDYMQHEPADLDHQVAPGQHQEQSTAECHLANLSLTILPAWQCLSTLVGNSPRKSTRAILCSLHGCQYRAGRSCNAQVRRLITC